MNRREFGGFVDLPETPWSLLALACAIVGTWLIIVALFYPWSIVGARMIVLGTSAIAFHAFFSMVTTNPLTGTKPHPAVYMLLGMALTFFLVGIPFYFINI